MKKIKNTAEKNTSVIPEAVVQVNTDAQKLYYQQNSSQQKAIEDDELHIYNPITNAASTKVNKTVTYLPGTHIYYGASIALKARHGGYFSFFNPTDLKASAHKIMPTSKFIIIKCGDITNKGVVRYGDPIWLMSSPTEVLGAHYSGGVIELNRKRKIHPALISCKRHNIFKAQQYGRWILLNKEKPIETIGAHVGNEDKVILEQEWYFLSSLSPYDCGMYKTKSDIDQATRNGSDLFNPGDECTWKVVLCDHPHEADEGERKRAKQLSNANFQIDRSKAGRAEKAIALLTHLKDKMDHTLTEDYLVQHKLAHTLEFETQQQYYVCKFAAMSARNFEIINNSPGFLLNIYGDESNIYKFRRQVMFLHAKQHQGEKIKKNEIKEVNNEPLTAVEQHSVDYWNTAQKLLVNTKVITELDYSMRKYYKIDYKKKNRAARVLQRSFRKYIRDHKMSFTMLMKEVDVKVVHRLKRSDRLSVIEDALNATEAAPVVEEKSMEAVDAAAGAGNEYPRFSDDAFITSVDMESSLSIIAPEISAKAGIISTDHVIDTDYSTLVRPNSSAYVAADKSKRISFSMPKYMVPVKVQRPATSSAIVRSNKSMLNMKPVKDSSKLTLPFISNESLMFNSSVNSTSYIENFPSITEKLARSSSNDLGLPHDVFLDPLDPTTSIDMSMKFLRSVSSHNGIYTDIGVKKRENKSVRPHSTVF